MRKSELFQLVTAVGVIVLVLMQLFAITREMALQFAAEQRAYEAREDFEQRAKDAREAAEESVRKYRGY